MPPADHPVWVVLKMGIPLLCATVSLVVMLVFNYNSVDHRDAVTTLVVAISTACGSIVAGGLLGRGKSE